MRTIEEYTSITTMIEKLIERENENIAIYERTIHAAGDCLVKPLLLSIAQEKREHRELLERELSELNEQFSLDEAII